jgi:hypothetical protein
MHFYSGPPMHFRSGVDTTGFSSGHLHGNGMMVMLGGTTS